MNISRSMKGERRALIQHQAGRDRSKSERERERGGGSKRKIGFRLCSVKGEITHLRRFFQATTGSIDQATGFMSQFSTWNIDSENSFYPCLLAISHSFSLSFNQSPPCVDEFTPVTLAALIRAVKWRCFDCDDDEANVCTFGREEKYEIHIYKIHSTPHIWPNTSNICIEINTG